MKHLHVFALLIVMVIEANLLAQQATTTTWSGVLDANGTELRLEFDITESEMETTGKLRSLDQNNATFKAKLNVNDKGLSFEISQIRAKFEGTFDTEKKTLDGTFTQAGQTFPLRSDERGKQRRKRLRN